MNTRINELEVAAQNALTPLPFAAPAMSPHAQAMEAHAKALVNARFIMALQRPRNWDRVRQDVLKECRRPSFANDKSAIYKKPIGNSGVEGLGIRFVEMALSCMTNILVEQHVIYEDDERRVVNVSVTDLERNITHPKEVTVTKTVERSKPADDGSYIKVRTNSYGKMTYTVPATDDDLLNKEAALVSKALRMCGLRVIPGDIQSEAEEAIKATRRDEAARDPDAERNKIVDGFSRLNVPADQLIEYVGHDLASCSPAELAELRAVWGTIEEGETTWAATIEHRRKERATPKADTKPEPKRDPQSTAGQQEQKPAGRKSKGVAAAEALQKQEREKQAGAQATVSGPGGEAKARPVIDPSGEVLFDTIALLGEGSVGEHKGRRYKVFSVESEVIRIEWTEPAPVEMPKSTQEGTSAPAGGAAGAATGQQTLLTAEDGAAKRREVLVEGGKLVGFYDGEVDVGLVIRIDGVRYRVVEFSAVMVLVVAQPAGS